MREALKPEKPSWPALGLPAVQRAGGLRFEEEPCRFTRAPGSETDPGGVRWGSAQGQPPGAAATPSCGEQTVQPSAEHKGEIHAHCSDEGRQPLHVIIDLYPLTGTVTQRYSLSSKCCAELM